MLLLSNVRARRALGAEVTFGRSIGVVVRVVVTVVRPTG
jgi:hypothetical protein